MPADDQPIRASMTLYKEVARILGRAATPGDAVPEVLGALLRATRWDIAVFWLRDPTNHILRCEAVVSVSPEATEAFEMACRATKYEERSVRAVFANNCGLTSALSVPITHQASVAAGLELFARPMAGSDAGDRDAVDSVADQLGQFLDHLDMQAELSESQSRLRAMLDGCPDAVISIEADGRIIEWNPTAETVFGFKRDEVLGQDVAELIIPPSLRPFHKQGLARYLATGERRLLGQQGRLSGLRKDGSQFPLELSIVRVETPGPPRFTAFLRDTTSEHQIEQALVESGQRYADQARSLQTSLLPPELPVIPGLDVAVRYIPADQDSEVGGDFYDVFESAPDAWGVVVGDVEGKGAEAGAISALTRFTIRALALREASPAMVLTGLNEAIIVQRPGRLCTAVHARLVRASGRFGLTIASGGHPLPFRLSGGRVEQVGTHGTMLGVKDDPAIRDSSVELDHNDILVFFTDGLTEARSPSGVFLRETTLHDVLRQCDGLAAEATAERLEELAIDFQGGHRRDDLALVVVKCQPA